MTFQHEQKYYQYCLTKVALVEMNVFAGSRSRFKKRVRIPFQRLPRQSMRSSSQEDTSKDTFKGRNIHHDKIQAKIKLHLTKYILKNEGM